MKLFGYEFRKFEEENTTLEAIETWCVSWYSIYTRWAEEDALVKVKQQVQGFPTKGNAKIFAVELREAIKLLGHKGYSVKVFKQITPTNKK